MSNKDTELKPKNCPFCGGEGQIGRYARDKEPWFVTCYVNNCVMYGYSACGYKTRAEAITAWNTRAAPPEIRELLEEYQRICMNFATESHHKGTRSTTEHWTDKAKAIKALLTAEPRPCETLNTVAVKGKEPTTGKPFRPECVLCENVVRGLKGEACCGIEDCKYDKPCSTCGGSKKKPIIGKDGKRYGFEPCPDCQPACF